MKEEEDLEMGSYLRRRGGKGYLLLFLLLFSFVSFPLSLSFVPLSFYFVGLVVFAILFIFIVGCGED